MKGISSISQYALLTLLTGIVIMFAACGSDEEYKWESWEATGSEATVSVQSEDGTSESLEAGTTLGVYVVNEDGTVTWVNATVDQYGNVILPPDALTGKTIVYTPVQPGWGQAAFNGTPSFYVKADQSDEDDYDASDLMIGTVTATTAAARAFTRAGTSISLSLKHMMAKVVIHVVDETGIMDFRTASLSLLRMKNGVTVSLPQQSVTTIGNSVSDIEMQAYNITDRRLSMRAIVAPQTKEAGEELFELTVPGTRRSCILPTTAEMTPEQTYVYQVRYTVDGPVLESSYITNWNSAEEEADFTIRTDK